MLKILLTLGALTAALPSLSAPYVQTSAYKWEGDTITQGSFHATSTDGRSLTSTYHATPGYFMPIEQQWQVKNDLSPYPQLLTPNKLHTAIYNLGLDEMVNAVEPDTTLRTGKEWAGVWTRDVSYSILLSMAYMQPEAARISLEKKVDRMGRIIQDTGSGGAWPVSSDRQIWTVAAWEVYKVTGDRKWLDFIYPVVLKSLTTDAATIYDETTGLVRGETSFIDWREQSHPKWMQTADVFNTLTLSTSVVHSHAWSVLALMADLKGDKKVAAEARKRAAEISEGINKYLWSPQLGLYAMYMYGRDNLIINPRAETLGESLAILWDIASPERAREITESNPTTPFGPAIFYPQISDMPPYHNNALWPWVGAWWTIANAKVGNEQGVMEGFGSLFRPAALFCTNKENFNLDNGDIATELNSSNMLWCLAGNIALTHKVLFGISYDADRLCFAPFVPEALGQTRSLTGFPYRGATLNITVEGFGNKIKEFTVNGKKQEPYILAKKAKGTMDVRIVMDSEPIPPLKVNHQPNRKAPLTPIVWLEGKTLVWNPIEYINHYEVLKDGEKIAEVRTTTFETLAPGEYQVIGVADDGTPSFASEPRSTRLEKIFEMPVENYRQLVSTEIPKDYIPASIPVGFTGEGFIELDKSSKPVQMEIEVPLEGDYFLSARYSNGNGPVNTENRCAIRTVSIDGTPAGILVLPQRGRSNWNDWGYSNSLLLPALTPGKHTVTIDFRPDNENMNIDTNHALLDHLRLIRK